MKEIDLETQDSNVYVHIACEGFKCYVRVFSKPRRAEYYLEFSSDEITKLLALFFHQKFDESVDEVFKDIEPKN